METMLTNIENLIRDAEAGNVKVRRMVLGYKTAELLRGSLQHHEQNTLRLEQDIRIEVDNTIPHMLELYA